jgi:hypothetical protein
MSAKTEDKALGGEGEEISAFTFKIAEDMKMKF